MQSEIRRSASALVAATGIALAAAACGGRSDTEATGSERSSPAVETAGSIQAADLLTWLDEADAPAVLDVRTPEEYSEGHIPGAINIPYDDLPLRLASLEEYRDRGLVVYCRTGRRAGIAEATLSEAGFDRIWDLEGHMVAWLDSELPLAFSTSE